MKSIANDKKNKLAEHEHFNLHKHIDTEVIDGGSCTYM